MTLQEFTATATSKINNLSTAELKAEAKKLVNNFEAGADAVLNIVFDILMERMPESEFVEFCDSL
jgi:hypothetical protein